MIWNGGITNRVIVAQLFNLLYRRFPIGEAFDFPRRVKYLDTQQSAILRYGRLKIRAT
jgi:hypothetical protein